MYKKNKMLSAIAAVAILSTGAVAFDMNKAGEIFAVKGGFDGQITNDDTKDINISDNNAYPVDYNEDVDTNGAQKRVAGAPVVKATYLGGVEASEPMKLSSTGKGDALIYPAFRTGDGWSTEIIVRNTHKTAMVAKAVLYAADDSRELLDFNIYLSSHDAFRFNINEDGTITTRDGSYAKGVDPTYETDKVEFVNHEKETWQIGKLDANQSGYVVIYGMIQARTQSYHNNHKKLYEDYRSALDLCRDSDGIILNNLSRNGIPMPQWRRAYVENGVVNGTLTLPSGVGAPNVDANCTDANNTASFKKYITLKKSSQPIDHFTSPSKDALFGSVRIQHNASVNNPNNRDLLLPATAIENFTTGKTMMLWATGEYASIQDRRLQQPAGKRFSEYNTTGILRDADTFLVKSAYYTFNKDENNIERNTILVTQPMKRPLVQIGDPAGYWDNEGTADSPWGDFKLQYRLYDDNELEYAEQAGLQHITSPYNTDPKLGYINELQPLRDLEEDKDLIKGTNGEYFKNGTHGYADMNFYGNRNTGLPAIITQMSSSQVGGQTQINWVYSTVVK